MVIAYSLVFYTLFEYTFFKADCEEWNEKPIMLSAGKILIPNKIPVCKKWKLKEEQNSLQSQP